MIIWVFKYIPYVLILIAGIAMLRGLYAARNKVSAVALPEAVKRLCGRPMLLCIVLSVLFFAANAVIKYCYNSVYPSLLISFNYENAAKGKNPSGTRFNVSEILSNDVLDEAISRSGYKVSTEDLKECLSLETNFDDVDISDDASKDELSSLNIATDYRLIFNPGIKTLGINCKTMLSLIGDVYYEKFMREKTENVAILDLDFSDYDSSDYYSISSYLKVKADNLKHFIDIYSYVDSNYRGTNGDSFAALSGKIESFSNVELERLHSYVIENGLSRDAAGFSNTIDYKNKLLQLDYDKNMAAYYVRLEAIDMYDHQMARIVLVPTQDEKLEYYMSRTKIGVDDFANQAQEYLEDAKKLKNEIDDNTYAQSRVNEGAATEAAYSEADALADTLIDELKSLAEECKTIVNTYNADKKNALMTTDFSQKSLSSMINLKKSVLLTVVFCGLLCISSVCSIMYADNKGRKKVKKVRRGKQ